MEEKDKKAKTFEVVKTVKGSLDQVSGLVGDIKFLIAGTVLTIISTIVLVAGLATVVAALLVASGYSTFVSVLIALLAVGLIGVAGGILIMRNAYRKVKIMYKKLEMRHEMEEEIEEVKSGGIFG